MISMLKPPLSQARLNTRVGDSSSSLTELTLISPLLRGLTQVEHSARQSSCHYSEPQATLIR